MVQVREDPAREEPVETPPAGEVEGDPVTQRLLLVVAVGEVGALGGSLCALVEEGAMVWLTSNREAAARWLLAAPASDYSFGETESRSVAQIGRLRISLKEGRVTWAGAQLPFSASELRILALLAQEPGGVFSFEEITHAAWGNGYFGDSSATRSAIARIRKKLLATRDEIRIESARGMGFRLLCEVSETALPDTLRRASQATDLGWDRKLDASRLTG